MQLFNHKDMVKGIRMSKKESDGNAHLHSKSVEVDEMAKTRPVRKRARSAKGQLFSMS